MAAAWLSRGGLLLAATCWATCLFTAVAQAGNVVVTADTRWDWTGCNSRDLCECKLHGKVGGIKGSDIASECKDNGYAVPKVDKMQLLYDAMNNNKFEFQCDSLKLNTFCFSQNGCLTEVNKAFCTQMKGSTCDVDCSGAVAGHAAPAVATALAFLAALVAAQMR
mmetsp:Transcript_115017/g.245654  ORF Transcript_115017/g.245654 Transcript_115017/m.245654 type:complete len:165 (-) Transcript_115017:152-646(-)